MLSMGKLINIFFHGLSGILMVLSLVFSSFLIISFITWDIHFPPVDVFLTVRISIVIGFFLGVCIGWSERDVKK